MTPDTVWKAPIDSATHSAASPSGAPLRVLYGVAFGLVLLAGGLSLAMPFWGDQALFAVYGRQLADGAVLYRDLFDLKQPGIFAFYALGGLLFGFTEVGIHLFELAYWLLFSIFAVVTLRPYLKTRWAVPLVPVFTIVIYYMYAGTLELTQLEALVAFPILVAWWLIDQADPATRRGVQRYAAAGVVAASVVMLKHLYVAIVVAFLVYAVLRARAQGISIAHIRRSVGAFAIGALVPLFVVAGYFAIHGQLGRIWWAYFEYSLAKRTLAPAPFIYLSGGARRFLVGHAPLVIMATLGTVHALRHRLRPQVHLVAGMVLWLAIGVSAVVVQYWGQWHWLLFTIPIGILAVLGVEALAATGESLHSRPQRAAVAVGTVLGVVSFLVGASTVHAQKWLLIAVVVGGGAAVAGAWLDGRKVLRKRTLQVLTVALVASVGLMLIEPVSKLQVLVQHDFAFSAEARTHFQRAWNPAYSAADEDLDLLYRSGDVLPGPIYVFGDPVLLLRANRPQAAPMHGWGPAGMDLRAWQELHRDLRSSLPPYVVVDAHAESVIRSRYPALLEFIEVRYETAFHGASGVWYVRQ